MEIERPEMLIYGAFFYEADIIRHPQLTHNDACMYVACCAHKDVVLGVCIV